MKLCADSDGAAMDPSHDSIIRIIIVLVVLSSNQKSRTEEADLHITPLGGNNNKVMTS